MFSKRELDRVLDLHEKSYQLFMWINERFRERNPPFEKLTKNIMHAEKASQWMEKNYKSFPGHLRIELEDIDLLSHLFSSFLNTSFELADAYIESSHGCGPSCGYCSHWLVGKHLKRRNITNKDRQDAAALKRIYIQQLAIDNKKTLSDKDVTSFVTQNEDLAHSITVATYGHELVRRSKYQSQGAASLVLWQEMNPKPKRTWRKKKRKTIPLIARTFLEVEKKILSQLKK